jgi:ribosomal protein L37AE/L43A
MPEQCPTCGGDLVPLGGGGIFTCKKCRKLVRKTAEQDAGPVTQATASEDLNGAFYERKRMLNPQYEKAVKGLHVFSEGNIRMDVLLAYEPDFPRSRYLRLSWWKGGMMHHGMVKINHIDVARNLVKALRMIDVAYDDDFAPIGDFGVTAEAEEDFDFNFDQTRRECPNCKRKMKKSRTNRYFECEWCGEIVIIEDGVPIYSIPPTKLTLAFNSNYPINYYSAHQGITFSWQMGDWQAAVVIFDPNNPNKKWLRIYWWIRRLDQYMAAETRVLAQGIRWEPRKGAGSTNIYNKAHLKEIIKAMETLMEEWHNE